MKFLTEDDLRVAYRNGPFEAFTIHKNTRLTPGAKTFLMDRKIQIIDENIRVQKGIKSCKGTAKVDKKVDKRNVHYASLDEGQWFAIRCELLETAYDLTDTDVALAEELTLLERYLADSILETEMQLTPILTVGQESENMDKSVIVGNLSNVGLFLKTAKGRVLTKLYPIYFHLGSFANQEEFADNTRLQECVNRLGQLIAYYLNKSEEVIDDS